MMMAWTPKATKKRAIVGHPSIIPAYHEEGTGTFGPRGKPYVIRPVRKKALAFKTATGVVVTKRVLHPGIRQRRQLPTEAEIRPEIDKVASIGLKKVTK
jgi:hypothetical protein